MKWVEQSYVINAEWWTYYLVNRESWIYISNSLDMVISNLFPLAPEYMYLTNLKSSEVMQMWCTLHTTLPLSPQHTHRPRPTAHSGGSHRDKVWWVQPYIQTTFIAVEMESLGKLTWIIYLKRQNVTSCLPLSVFWFRLNEGRADSMLCLLTDFASAGILLPFRKFGTYRIPMPHKCV